MLFSKIIIKRLIAQWVWPGLLIGLKFNLNSEDKVFKIKDRVNFIFELDNQKMPGIHRIVNKELIQFNLKFSHNTLGSKIENKLLITLNNKF